MRYAKVVTLLVILAPLIVQAGWLAPLVLLFLIPGIDSLPHRQ